MKTLARSASSAIVLRILLQLVPPLFPLKVATDVQALDMPPLFPLKLRC
jgi:hypothetical protein